MNADYSARDRKVHKILKRRKQKPVLERSYNDCLDILLWHFQLTKQIPRSKSGYIIGINPFKQCFQVFQGGDVIWKKVVKSSNLKSKNQ